jgi:hypothetical protein
MHRGDVPEKCLRIAKTQQPILPTRRFFRAVKLRPKFNGIVAAAVMKYKASSVRPLAAAAQIMGSVLCVHRL